MNAWPRRALYQIRWQLKEKSKAPEQLTSEEQGGDIVVIVLPPRVLDEWGFVCELFVNVILFENYLIVCELYNNLCSIVCSTFHFVFWRMQIVFGICQVCFLSGVWFHLNIIVCSFWYLWCLYLQFMKCMVEIYAFQFEIFDFVLKIMIFIFGIWQFSFRNFVFCFENYDIHVWDLTVYFQEFRS